MAGISRRTMLGSTGAAALASSPAAAATNPDAVLIQVCADYLDALDTFDAYGGNTVNEEDDPLWRRYMAALERAKAIKPTTMSGLVALAQVAIVEARQPDGREDFSTSFTGDWPERVVRGLLAITGSAGA